MTNGRPNAPHKPHALYRFFDDANELLYVGITNNPSRRFTQHGVDREWWHEVTTIRMEPHSDRNAVLAAEKVAIKVEHPRYNVVHASGAPVTAELPPAGKPGDYPVAVGEAVALALAPNHHSEAECPVGMVIEVSRFGVRLQLFKWLIGVFGGSIVLIPWHRIMEVQWAETLDEWTAQERGYGRRDDVFEMDGLAYMQTKWVHGRERAKADAQRG